MVRKLAVVVEVVVAVFNLLSSRLEDVRWSVVFCGGVAFGSALQEVFRKLLQQKLVKGVERVIESEVARVDEPERMPKTILVDSQCGIIYRLGHVEVLACEQESDKEASVLHCEL